MRKFIIYHVEHVNKFEINLMNVKYSMYIFFYYFYYLILFKGLVNIFENDIV